jgi:hypothetical protein
MRAAAQIHFSLCGPTFFGPGRLLQASSAGDGKTIAHPIPHGAGAACLDDVLRSYH